MKIKTVIFDLDGTLLDTLNDLKNSANYALKQNGYPERTTDEIRMFVGNGISLLMERAIPEGKKNPDFEKALSELKSHYAQHSLDTTCPYDGIIKMLDQLKAKGIATAIVSNKPDPQVKKLSQIFFSSYMTQETSIGECADVKRKPAPDSVLKVLEITETKKENALFVGDSDVDIQTAENAGLKCISVSWGFRDREFLTAHNAATIIDSPSELLNLLD